MKVPKNWVWIRGLARESGHWGEYFELFKKSFPEARVSFLDLPGAGDNRHLEPGFSLSDTLTQLRSQMQKRIGAEKFTLFSVSMGAMLAMEWMNQYPEDIEACVLVNSSSGEHSSIHHRLRLQAYPLFLKALSASDTRKREMAILELVSNNVEKRKAVLSDWVKIAKNRPMKYSSVLKQLFSAARYRPPRKLESLPTLLLVSLGDRMVEPQCSYDLGKAYSWEVKSHPWAGHDLTLDDPEWVINAMQTWFEQQKMTRS